MTAIKVLDNHAELAGAGLLSHDVIDSYLLSASFIVASGSIAPSTARILSGGTGISINDLGPGNLLTISVTTVPSTFQFSWNEIPTGLNDGINNIFMLANSPNPTNALMFFINGVKQRQGMIVILYCQVQQ